jgi:hypothetical protein
LFDGLLPKSGFAFGRVLELLLSNKNADIIRHIGLRLKTAGKIARVAGRSDGAIFSGVEFVQPEASPAPQEIIT